MTTLDALLADILANPEEMTLRLILADYLEDSEEDEFDRRANALRDGVKTNKDNTDLSLWAALCACNYTGRALPNEMDAYQLDKCRCAIRCGFISAVEVPLRLWTGPPNVGPAHGPMLLARQPIVWVRASGKDPEYSNDGSTFIGWYWYSDGRAEEPDDIPESIWDLLEGEKYTSRWRRYVSVEDANADLSQALLAFARKEKP